MIQTALAFVLLTVSMLSAQSQDRSFRDRNFSPDERVTVLLRQLSLEEKISLLGYDSPGIPRLGIPPYNWWNEALHGVARAGEATVFPQAIGMAATFDDSLIHQVASIISTEARAKYNMAVRENRRGQYMGLTFWSPNINIFRDPRWGRGQETYGEDPLLTSKMGVAFVKGLQGDDPQYIKASAGAKHYAVHSGPEADRHKFNARVNEKDLRETYLYAFHAAVNAGVESVMCAYNRVNDEPCCTSDLLLNQILMGEWDFDGHVITDCGALYDIWKEHALLESGAEVAAAAVEAGINVDCSDLLQKYLHEAIEQKLVTEQDIDSALIPALKTRVKLGLFDDDDRSPFRDLDSGNIRTSESLSLARIVARKSMVLLKNNKNLLPLDKTSYNSIMVVGANATSADALLGNYHGMSPNLVTFAEGITRAAGPGVAVQYDQGSDYADTVRFGGIWAAGLSDITVAVIGLTPVLEGEEGDAFLAPNGGDRADLGIPDAHIAYLRAMRKSHDKPIVAVVTAGSAVDISEIEPYADAIVLAWYPGEQGGNALADILFGIESPSGRLPVTFYRELSDLPPYEDYSMKGRTYRYFTGDAQYPFGFGLSFTTFEYERVEELKRTYRVRDTISISVAVRNTGNLDGDEVVQAYVIYPPAADMPVKELKAFKRIHVPIQGKRNVRLRIPVSDLQKWNTEKQRWEVKGGMYEIRLGSHSEDARQTYQFIVRP